MKIQVLVFIVIIASKSHSQHILNHLDDHDWGVVYVSSESSCLSFDPCLWDSGDFMVYSITGRFCRRFNMGMWWENWVISGHTKYRLVRLKRNLPHNHVHISNRCALCTVSVSKNINSIHNNFSSKYELRNGSVLEWTIIRLVACWMVD